MNEQKPVPKEVIAELQAMKSEKYSDLIDALIEDYKARSDEKAAEYGTPLTTFNGRGGIYGPYLDLYEEALDAMAYAMQCIMEGDEDAIDIFRLTVLLCGLVKTKKVVIEILKGAEQC